MAFVRLVSCADTILDDQGPGLPRAPGLRRSHAFSLFLLQREDVDSEISSVRWAGCCTGRYLRMRCLDDGLQRGGRCRRVFSNCDKRWRAEPSRLICSDEMAWAAIDLSEATPSCHVCGLGKWPCDKWDKGADKSAKGDDPKSGVHFRAAPNQARTPCLMAGY
jgi:hypothetical protein